MSGLQPDGRYRAARYGYNACVRYLTIILALALCGCAFTGGDLKSRAADYYNFMAGNTPKVAAASFLSPAYRTDLDVKAYNEAMGRGKRSSGRRQAAEPDDVYVAQQGKFAITVMDPDKGRSYASLEPVKWVKAGMRWYVYIGASAEIVRYGEFPAGLRPPVVRKDTGSAEAGSSDAGGGADNAAPVDEVSGEDAGNS